MAIGTRGKLFLGLSPCATSEDECRHPAFSTSHDRRVTSHATAYTYTVVTYYSCATSEGAFNRFLHSHANQPYLNELLTTTILPITVLLQLHVHCRPSHTGNNALQISNANSTKPQLATMPTSSQLPPPPL
jgi:hypothetical protein